MPETAPYVLHIASWYPSRNHGTLGNFVERHVEAIMEETPGELWYASPTPAAADFSGETGASSAPVPVRIAYFPARRPIFLQTMRALMRLEREEAPKRKPDLVHLHVAHPAGWAAVRLARKWDVPLVVTEHWTAYHADQSHRLTFWQRAHLKFVGRRATLACPVTADLGASMVERGFTCPVRPIPNVVNTELFRPRPHGDRPPHLLHISSLDDDQKNISGMLRALRRVLNERPDVRVTIVGDGDPEPHRRYAAECGLSDQVEISGEIPLTEVARLMQEATALLLFSRYENFPCVIPEAWATGIPVVTTDVGGIREYVTTENGRLVPSEDEDAWAQAVLATIDGTWDAGRIRHYAEEHFSKAGIAKAYRSAYREARRKTTARA